MKIQIVFMLLLSIALNVHGQINIYQPAPPTQDPNQYYINGISTREDIGGVDFEFIMDTYKIGSDYWGYSTGVGARAIKVTNYNDFPVSVIIEYQFPSDAEKIVRTVSLPPARNDVYPSKEIDISTLDLNFHQRVYRSAPNIRSITRRLGGQR